MKTIVALVVLCVFFFEINCETFYDRQKAVLNLFQHINQRNVHIENYDEIKTYKFDPEKFSDPLVYERYLSKRHENGINEIFSLSNQKHLEEAIALHDVFLAAKDLATLYRVAIIARYRVNPDLFVYSLTAALLHRSDMQDVVLPALYEIQPSYFFNSDVIEKAHQYKMQGFPGVKKDSSDGIYKVIIEANYTGMNFISNPESRLSYYTEDIGINSNYYYLHTYLPFWSKSENIAEKRSIVFLKYLKYMLSRYYLERLSNGLGKIPEFSWYEALPSGYNPQLRYPNGVTYPARNNYYTLFNPSNYYAVNEVLSLESLFRHELKNATPEKVYNLLGKYIMTAKQIFSGISNSYAPSTFAHFQTAMRDPMYFQLFNRAFKLFPKNVNPYNVEELKFDGVKIETVEMDKLTTFFDKFDADITHAVDIDVNHEHIGEHSKLYKFGRVSHYQEQDFVIKARQQRLNHLPFTYKLNVLSDKEQQVKVKVFIGPKYDEYGRAFDINENRENFYELDYYSVDLKEGKNVLSRNCREFSMFSPDRTTYYDWYKNLMTSIEQNDLKPVQTSAISFYNYPWRMMLPRGKRNGMPVQFFFIIIPPTVDSTSSKTPKYFLYPLDRPIYETHWNFDNMYYYDTNIFHKTEKDIQNLN